MKNAEAAPSATESTISVHSCAWPVRSSTAIVSSATARMLSDDSITSWRGRRSAHTPPMGSSTTRAVVDAARTRPSALAEWAICSVANASATGVSASPAAETAWPVHR